MCFDQMHSFPSPNSSSILIPTTFSFKFLCSLSLKSPLSLLSYCLCLLIVYQLEYGLPFRDHIPEEHLPYTSAPKSSNCSYTREGHCAHLLSSRCTFNWLDVMQVMRMPSQPLLVHRFNKYSFHAHIYCLWLLEFSQPPSMSLSLEVRGCSIDVIFETDLSAVAYSLHVDQLWFSVLILSIIEKQPMKVERCINVWV